MTKFHFSPRENRADLINWRPWGEGAFEEAQREDKLILLSISAVWCHWCHVMDEESYSTKKIINLLNQDFIPIRVDNDRHPDVNRRYNLGGWPTTAVLTPEGDLLQGGTYIPPDDLYTFLQEIHKLYKKNRDSIQEKLKKINTQQNQIKPVKEQDLNKQIIFSIQSQILENYDQQYAGFGDQPKFPHFAALDFLLDEYSLSKDDYLEEILEKTLINMAEGGMYDHEMGGFFRYSTTRDWSIPHYEKMLEDNVKFLNIYLKAYQIFHTSVFREIALDIIKYLTDWLIDHENNLFYGSQDADEAYYQMTRKERNSVKAPFIDQTFYINWNGLAFSAFLRAYAVLDLVECRDIALKGIEFLLEHCFDSDLGMYHYYLDGQRHNPNLLEDQWAMATALLDAYQLTQTKRYLETAEKLTTIILERFYDHGEGGFFIDRPQSPALQRVNFPEKSLPLNSCLALLLLRLEVLTSKQKYRDLALKTLRLAANNYQDYGIFAATFAQAVSATIHGFTHITIIGDLAKSNVEKIYEKSIKIYSPHKIVEKLHPTKDEKRIKALGYNLNDQAYICKGKRCYPPVKDAEKIGQLLENIQR